MALPVGCPVSMVDVIDAARTPLGLVQRPAYMPWRLTRWYTDADVVRQAKEQRADWEWDQHRTHSTIMRKGVFDLPLCQDILIAAFPAYPPQHVITVLDAWLVDPADPVDQFTAVFAMLDDVPLDVCRAFASALIPAQHAKVLVGALGDARMTLMVRAGLRAAEIVSVAVAPDSV